MSKTVVFIQDVFILPGVGPVPVGVVRSGTLTVGMNLTIAGTTMSVASIEMHHKQVSRAEPGSSVGISFTGASADLLNAVVRSEVTFSSPDESVNNHIIETPKPNHPKGFFGSLFARLVKK